MDEKKLINILDKFQEKFEYRLNARLDSFSQRISIIEKQLNETHKEVSAAHRRLDVAPSSSGGNGQIVAVNKQLEKFAREVKKEINNQVANQVKREVAPVVEYAKYKLEDGEETLYNHRIKNNRDMRPAITGPSNGKMTPSSARLYYQDGEL